MVEQAIFEEWRSVSADLHERYGIDVDSGILHERSWPWLRGRVRALFDVPPALTILPDGHIIEIHQTRIGHRLFPPGRE